jgi:Flp pilus assembly protein TadB
MHTPAGEPNGDGVAASAKRVADHAKTLVGLELELARLEMKRKVGAVGAGAGLMAAAALAGLFALAFLLATVAAALALVVSTWLALLLVAVGLLVLAGVLVLVGRSRMREATPPVPEQAIREAKLTTEALRSDGDV